MPNNTARVTRTHWKTDIDDLRSRAEDVHLSGPVRQGVLTSAEVARALLSVVSFVQSRYGIDEAQQACAELARFDLAWSSNLTRLPMEGGIVKPSVLQLVVGCAGLLDLAGEKAVRSALSFWAIESDPSVWRRLLK